MPAVSSTSELIKRFAVEAGFDLAGIAPVREFPDSAHFEEWIAKGYAGEMRYLEARTEAGELKRSSLRQAAPWARSVVVCAINYNVDEPRSIESHHSPKAGERVGHPQSSVAGHRSSEGWISRYAWSREDYHDSVLRRLRQVEAALKREVECRTCCYVDTGPVVERMYAKYAGVGWQGKNTCILNQEIGSWLFLGVMLTSLELEPDLPAPDRCGTCTACLDACPTSAFAAPYVLDATKCISYLTIEKRGEIPEELREGIGRHVFGCDICQDVCPWNRRAPSTSLPEFQPRERLVNPALLWLAEMTVEEFRERFRGSPIKRTKFSGIRRNVAIAMGNSGNERFVPHLERLAEDEDENVAAHARWALEKLKTGVR
ncbi:MAG: tRNA epoxyqueuosine(34) reductase QueG [Terriglobales bacterium]